MRPLLSVFPLRSLTALVTLYSPVESNCYEEEDVIVPKVIQCHPYSYLSLLFMKRTQCVKEVQGVLTPLSWAEHNCNTFTGITFLIELWRTKLHSSIVITTSLFCTSSKSLKVLSTFQHEPHAASVTGWKYIHVCHGNFYIPSETESEELARTSLNPEDEARNSESPSEQWNTAWSLPASPSLHLHKIRCRKMHAFCPVASLSVSHLFYQGQLW